MKNSLKLSTSEVTQLLKNEGYVIRLKNDALGLLRYTMNLGATYMLKQKIDDKILMKADGMPISFC